MMSTTFYFQFKRDGRQETRDTDQGVYESRHCSMGFHLKGKTLDKETMNTIPIISVSSAHTFYLVGGPDDFISSSTTAGISRFIWENSQSLDRARDG